MSVSNTTTLAGAATSNATPQYFLTSSNAVVTWDTPPIDAFLWRFKASQCNTSPLVWTLAFGDITSAYTYTFSNTTVASGYSSNSVQYTTGSATISPLSSNLHEFALKCAATSNPDTCQFALFVDSTQVCPTNSVPSMSFSNGGFSLETTYAPSNTLIAQNVDFTTIMTVAQPMHVSSVYASTYLNLPDFNSNSAWCSNALSSLSNYVSPQLGSNVSGWYLSGTSAVTACNVGIGTAVPTCALDVTGVARVTSNLISPMLTCAAFAMTIRSEYDINYIADYDGNNQGANHIFWATSNERMRLTPWGYLGVGTSSPAQMLDVVGVIQASSNILINGVPVATSNIVASNLESVANEAQSNLNILANATNYALSHVMWSNIVDAPPAYTTSNSSNSTVGVNWGNTIIQGVVGGAAGLATQYALQIGGKGLFDMAGNVATSLSSQIASVADSEITSQLFGGPASALLNSAIDTEMAGRFSTGYFPSAKWGLTSVAIDGSNHTVFCGLTASNIGVTYSSNAISACNVPLSLQTITGSNAPTVVAQCSGSNFSASNVICNQLTTPGTLYSTGTINAYWAGAGCNGTFVELNSNGVITCGGGPYQYNKLVVSVRSNYVGSFIQSRMNESNSVPLTLGVSPSNWFPLYLQPSGGTVAVGGNFTNPTYPLEVTGIIRATSNILVDTQPVALNASLSNYQLVTAATSFSNYVSPQLGSNVSGWYLSGTSAVTACNVGIATASPACALDVTGVARVTSNLICPLLTCGAGQMTIKSEYDINYWADFDGNNQGANHIFWATSNERMRLTPWGYLGIGTSSPAQMLDVVGVIQASSNVLVAGVPLASSNALSNYQSISAAVSFSNWVSPLATGAASVNNSGWTLGASKSTTSCNVGIGTGSPAYTLDVAGNARVTGTITTNYLTANSNAYVSGSLQSGYLLISPLVSTCNLTSSNITTNYITVNSNAYATGSFQAGYQVTAPNIGTCNLTSSNIVSNYLTVANNVYVTGSLSANYALTTTTVTACNGLFSNVNTPVLQIGSSGCNFTPSTLAYGHVMPSCATVSGNSTYANELVRWNRIGDIVTVTGQLTMIVNAAYSGATAFNMYNLPYSIYTLYGTAPNGVVSGSVTFSPTNSSGVVTANYQGIVLPVDTNNIQLYVATAGFSAVWVLVSFNFSYLAA